MNNADLFLEAYNTIDRHLKTESSSDSYEPFASKVKNSKNTIVKRYKDELLSFGELRNAIVHSNRIENKVIAEPHEEIVKKLLLIRDEILKPKKVYPSFAFEVFGAYENNFIREILIKMRNHSFSQFPVYNQDKTVKELVTTNTISRWLSSNIEDDGSILVEDVKVENLLLEIEYQHNYKFVSRDSTMYYAYELFTKHAENTGFNLDALFITNSGKSTEQLLGLITIADITNELRNT